MFKADDKNIREVPVDVVLMSRKYTLNTFNKLLLWATSNIYSLLDTKKKTNKHGYPAFFMNGTRKPPRQQST